MITKQFTPAQAIALHDGGEWKDWTASEIVQLQINQDCLCVPFRVFHAAIESVLCRKVFTHELATDELKQEWLNNSSASGAALAHHTTNICVSCLRMALSTATGQEE